MRLPTRDIIATILVAAAGVLYGLWAAGSPVPGLGSVRGTGLVVLALGFAASASAVVPSFEQLIHGNRAYVAVTSIIGLAAFIGGLQMLIAASDVGLGIVMSAMAVLWAIATVHHLMLARPTRAERVAGLGPPTAAAH